MTRSITVNDLYALQFTSRPAISPDGQRVAYVVTTIDPQRHVYRDAIWLASTTGGDARRLTLASANANSPSWSPDGRWLAFVSDREGDTATWSAEEKKKRGHGKAQVWVLPLDGGEARQVTFMQHGAAHPLWSPDSQQLLFSARVGPAVEETPDGKPLPAVRVIDRLWYRLDGVGFIHEHRTHLFLVEAEGGEPRQLTDGDWDDVGPAWSPDGTRIVFASDRSEDRWRLPGPALYILSLQDQALRQITTDSSLGCNAPAWSPDGKSLAFIGSTKVHASGQSYLYTVSVNDQQSEANCLTKGLDLSIGDWTNSDIGDEHLAPAPVWSEDGKTLYILGTYRGVTHLFAVPTAGSNVLPPTLTPGNIHVRDFTLDRAGQTVALLVGNPTHPQEIFVRSLGSSAEIHNVSHTNDAILSELALAYPERIEYAGADGWSIESWILKPHDFDPAKKYPLVVEIHGGPNTQYGYGFFHEMQLLAAQGYVVFYANPRGSLGYGYAFADAVRGAWAEKDSIDIMLGVDEVIKRGYIDEQRLAVTGGSYGGFMTNWLISHYDRFKVAITDRCVSNMASMFGSSDVGWDLASDNLDTTPWENLDKYMRMSPMAYVQNIHTPLLIIHSENDLRCNIEQAEQLFAALKWLGREVKFVRFEGQSHGLSRGGHPKLRLIRLQHMLDWFAQYL